MCESKLRCQHEKHDLAKKEHLGNFNQNLEISLKILLLFHEKGVD
jgi:hypothetical protein